MTFKHLPCQMPESKPIPEKALRIACFVAEWPRPICCVFATARVLDAVERPPGCPDASAFGWDHAPFEHACLDGRRQHGIADVRCVSAGRDYRVVEFHTGGRFALAIQEQMVVEARHHQLWSECTLPSWNRTLINEPPWLAPWSRFSLRTGASAKSGIRQSSKFFAGW